MNIKKREREKDGSERKEMREMGERASEREGGGERGGGEIWPGRKVRGNNIFSSFSVYY